MPNTLEAEILEIDGGPPPVPQVLKPESAWKSMRGKVLRLDRRWWPFWVLLALVVFAFVAVVGLILATLVVAAKGTGSILRFLSAGSASRKGTGSRRTFH